MKVAFFGDVHGRVLHALGAAVMLQKRRRIRLDAMVQVGDLGSFPSPERLDEATRRFIVGNPAEGDFFRLLDPSPQLAEGVRAALEQVPAFLFVSGNHEDHDWLAGLHQAAAAAVTPVDPLGAYRHVACGSVIDVAGQRVGFLGRIESDDMDYEPEAYDAFLAAEPGSVDILVTHDGPRGLSEYRGIPRGSAKLSRLIGHLRPRLHVGGHYHHQNGPRRYGSTVSYALADLVGAKTNHRTAEPVNPRQQIKAGSIGVLDTDTYDFEYVHDAWLAEVSGDRLDLAGLVEAE
ncbi:metallophosphoesterase [Actinospica sp. MGRD01-02]|uniref:Metallophosphoesterase n=1 Tax=Actinospica acidithermotolerans TaxID=2828514 RepID=A0A941EAH6_9ACTN|nr:metallophosphoesterase [Actinospica acidithermotolerans]MBR7827961.1 metallophosphoesterase [Actinospica acidithermotolerans]